MRQRPVACTWTPTIGQDASPLAPGIDDDHNRLVLPCLLRSTDVHFCTRGTVFGAERSELVPDVCSPDEHALAKAK